MTELSPVPDAFTPVIKMKFEGISIDLLYARLNITSIPEVRSAACSAPERPSALAWMITFHVPQSSSVLPRHGSPGRSPRLSLSQNLDLTNNIHLRGLDESSVRSVNGCRVTDRILQLVPEVSAFRTALRCIKARSRLAASHRHTTSRIGPHAVISSLFLSSKPQRDVFLRPVLVLPSSGPSAAASTPTSWASSAA